MRSKSETASPHPWERGQDNRWCRFPAGKQTPDHAEVQMEWVWEQEFKSQFLRVSTSRVCFVIYQDSSENWHPNQTWLTLYFPVAPTAAGRWGLNWVRTHWSSDIPKPDQIKPAVHISRACASDCKRESSCQTFLSIILVFETATRGQHDHLFFLSFLF